MIDIGGLTEIPARGARVVKTAFGCVAIFRTTGDQVFALDDRCPTRAPDQRRHCAWLSGDLSVAQLGVRYGHRQAQGADSGQVATYPVRIEAGRIWPDATGL